MYQIMVIRAKILKPYLEEFIRKYLSSYLCTKLCPKGHFVYTTGKMPQMGKMLMIERLCD